LYKELGIFGPNPRAAEVSDNERYRLINKEIPTEECNLYKCYKNWIFTKYCVEQTCPSKDWEAHKDGIHPHTAEKKAEHGKDTRRWWIGISLSILIIILTMISLYFQYCANQYSQ